MSKLRTIRDVNKLYADKPNKLCKYIIFASEETIQNDSLKGLSRNTKKLEDLYIKKIDALYDLLVASISEIENKD